MKNKIFATLLALTLALSLTACGSKSDDSAKADTTDDAQTEQPAEPQETVTLNVAASPTPHAEILKQCVPILAEQGIDLSGAIRHIREQVGHTTHIEVEVDRLDQIPQALAGGADTIMLDNFSLDDTRRGVDLIGGRAIVEASGTMTLERVPSVAATGVDVISVGALTHSVRSIDLGLDWA